MSNSIDKSKAFSWLTFGYQLGRLEFVWDAEVEGAKEVYLQIMRQLYDLIGDSFLPDETSYQSFANDVLLHYSNSDEFAYSMILIGISLIRFILGDDANKKEIIAFARSALDGIPNYIVKDKDKLFDLISRNKKLPLSQLANIIVESLDEPDTDRRKKKASSEYQVFISYRREGGEYLAGRLSDKLSSRGYKVFFDVESMKAGRFNRQLLDTIDQCKDVLVVLPPNGLDRCVNDNDWVRQEIAYALKAKKNIIPIRMKGFVFPANLPDDIADIRLMEGVKESNEYFDAVIDRIEQLLVCNEDNEYDELQKDNEETKRLFGVLEYVSVLNRDNGKRFTDTRRLDAISALLWETRYRRINADGLFNLYALKPVEAYRGKGVVIVSTHVDCAPVISNCFSQRHEGGILLGTYDNSITNAAIVSLMMSGSLPDDVLIAFTGDEEESSRGALKLVRFLQEHEISIRHLFVLDVTNMGWEDSVDITIENNFWRDDYGKRIIESVCDASKSWKFVPSDLDDIPSFVPAHKVIGAEAMADESWAYDEEGINCCSICIPVKGDMHSDAGVLVREKSYQSYIEVLMNILRIG